MGFLLPELPILPFQLVVLQPELLFTRILLRELLLHALIGRGMDLDESCLPVLVPLVIQLVQLEAEVGDQVVLHIKLPYPVPDHGEVLFKDPDDDLWIVLLELLRQVVELDGHLSALPSLILLRTWIWLVVDPLLPSVHPQDVELFLSYLPSTSGFIDLPNVDLSTSQHLYESGLLLLFPLSITPLLLDVLQSSVLALPVESLLEVDSSPFLWGPPRTPAPHLVSLFDPFCFQHLIIL